MESIYNFDANKNAGSYSRGSALAKQENPKLVEPGVRYFLKESLKNCQKYKESYFNECFNYTMLLCFSIGVTGVLVWKYKGKMTPEEQRIRDREKKEYILSKIHNFQESSQRMHEDLITGLPGLNSFFC